MIFLNKFIIGVHYYAVLFVARQNSIIEFFFIKRLLYYIIAQIGQLNRLFHSWQRFDE